LGGPDNPQAVKPFLRNLFRDPAIIDAPAPIREGLAWLISTLREKSAQKNYAIMGGGSPLLPETEKQARLLKDLLEEYLDNTEVRVFPAMRYWHPFIEDVVSEIENWAPDETVLLPLYPQFSTTTTGSSLSAWKKAGGGKARSICCYPTQDDFIKAHVSLIRAEWMIAGQPKKARLLFSAHGLPEKTIAKGDPYQHQISLTATEIAKQLPELDDWKICFQSRVGPMKWIGPSTDEAIIEASQSGHHIILAPIAFVSEHIETLVELDEEYLLLAEENGVVGYNRVPALGCHTDYIEGLSKLVLNALNDDQPIASSCGQRICPDSFSQCPCKGVEKAITT